MILELKSFANTKNFMEYESISGIYAFIHNNQVIYVGQSINIRRRLLSHHGFKNKIKTYQDATNDSGKLKYEFYKFLQENENDIYFLVVTADREQLNELEEQYIIKHQPKYNWSGVTTKYAPLKRYVW
jgi:excinuclease UvrABC nuclease subunit